MKPPYSSLPPSPSLPSTHTLLPEPVNMTFISHFLPSLPLPPSLPPSGPRHQTLNSRMIATWKDVMKNKQNLRLSRLPSFPASLPSLGASRR